MAYLTFYDSGLIANPHYLELSEKEWLAYINKLKKKKYNIKDSFWAKDWFALRDLLVEKGVDIYKVDEIIRSHHKKLDVILEWVAARDTLKKLARDLSCIKSKDEKMLPNKLVRPLLKEKARELQDEVSKIIGSGGLRKLTRKSVRGWPVFTWIINDLHEYLFPFFKTPGYDIYRSGKNPKWATYSTELLQIIASLLQSYYPSYFSGFTANHVKPRIKNHAE